ncbi:DUF551 domain-containing protein [Enterobacter hormaechei]
MSTFTKEQLIEKLQHRISVASGFPESEKAQMDLELARIALASLEAEPVCVIDQSNLDYLNAGSDADVWPVSRTEMGDVLLYRTAPPAPANAEPVAWLWSHRKHPSEVSLVRPEDDEKAEGAHWSGWSCQALYAAPPAPVSVPAAMEMDDDFDSAFEHGKAVGWNAYRAAMLQSFGNSEQLNSPVIPDGWVACSDRMPENKPGSYEYLVFESLNNVVHHDYWNVPDVGDNCQFTPFWNHYDRYVTHWMPLPAAPQQEA